MSDLDTHPTIAEQLADPRDSVNDQAVVDAIVRNFGKQVADAYDADLPHEEMVAQLDAAAAEAAKPFMGQDAKFATTAWNKPERLGAWLNDRVGPHKVADPARAVEQRFRDLGGEIGNIYIAHAGQAITDEQAQTAVNHHLNHATWDLLGFPDELRPGYVAPRPARRGRLKSQLEHALTTSRLRAAFAFLEHRMPDDAAWSIEVPIAKADDAHRTVYGWAVMTDHGDGQPIVDMDGDTIAPAELTKAAHHFMLTARNVGVEHSDYGPHLGQVVESVVMTPEVRKAMGLPPDGPTGWFVGMKIHDEDVWKGVKDGTYPVLLRHNDG